MSVKLIFFSIRSCVNVWLIIRDDIKEKSHFTDTLKCVGASFKQSSLLIYLTL